MRLPPPPPPLPLSPQFGRVTKLVVKKSVGGGPDPYYSPCDYALVLELIYFNFSYSLLLRHLPSSGCDHSSFLVVPDWYANGCCCVLNALEQTQYSMLNVYLVFKNKVHKVQVSEKYVQTTR
jgi:hypothetical protein